MRRLLLAGLCGVAAMAPAGAQAGTDFCGILKQVTDAAEVDFATIKTDDDQAGAYSVSVALPAADGCKLDRALEADFQELRYQCDFTQLNFAAAGGVDQADNINIVGLKYAGYIAGCRPDLTAKESESVWAKTTSFVDSDGQKWIDVMRMGTGFEVEVFNGHKNPNY